MKKEMEFFEQAAEARELKRKGFTQVQIGKQLDVSQPFVSHLLRAHRLPQEVRDCCERNTLSAEECTDQLGKRKAPPKQLQAALDVLKDRYGDRLHDKSRTTEFVREVERMYAPETKKQRRTSAEVGEFLNPADWAQHRAKPAIRVLWRWFEGDISTETARADFSNRYGA